MGGIYASTEQVERTKAAAHTVIAGQPKAYIEEFAAISTRLDSHLPATIDECGEVESTVGATIADEADRLSARQSTVSNRIGAQMAGFRRKYPSETTEMDENVASAPEYRTLHTRLVGDDLPRFESAFKEYLNTNTIRDIAGFYSQLKKQEELIGERITKINESLETIPYNEGRYIRLERERTPNTDVRDFIAQLRECTDSSVDHGDADQYSETKFLQVKSLIERLRGREGQADSDRNWARRVTDVRNWFSFTASERWRADDTEHENYTDSGGKSGGQKEKLAYTILAASLAYQFKLEWGALRSKTFRFAVIDEAFGRGSDESTRYGLELFRTLGLQLLIVTPLQKIRVIEPYVSSVGFVDNRDGNNSQLQCLTIEEYRERKRIHDMITVDTQRS